MARITKVEFPSLYPQVEPSDSEEEDQEEKGLGMNDPGVNQQFGWYYVIDVMSKGDILKQEEILELPFKRILFHMVYLNKSNPKK